MKITIEDLIEKLQEEFEDIPEGEIQPRTAFDSIENWGSMHILILIALADVNYQVQLTGADLKGLRTVQDLYDLIIEKSN